MFSHTKTNKLGAQPRIREYELLGMTSLRLDIGRLEVQPLEAKHQPHPGLSMKTPL